MGHAWSPRASSRGRLGAVAPRPEHTRPPQRPLPRAEAWPAVGRCALVSAELLARGRVHLPRGRVGSRMRFADGTSAIVYRETRVGGGAAPDVCALVVTFRLRGVHGRGHTLFRRESILNTPLFVGFPGFRSKLWLAADEHGRYRGVYEWDGPQRAERYARSLWRVLALVSARGSIRYTIQPGLRRDELVDRAPLLQPDLRRDDDGWWLPVGRS